jgi:transcriptional regulator with XRE-family HTH domain
MIRTRRRPSAAADVLGRAIRETRSRLGWTQRRLAGEARVSQAAVWRLETGRADELRLGDIVAITEALGGRFEPTIRAPVLIEQRRQRDEVHARLIAYVVGRLEREGWLTAIEVEIRRGAVIGWIDILAFRPLDSACLAIEIKSELVDLGGALRQVGWYTREAAEAARVRGWQPRSTAGALLLLDSRHNHQVLHSNARLIQTALPGRAPELLDWLRAAGRPPRPAVAMIDPRSRRTDWLTSTLADHRRRPIPYRDLSEFRAAPAPSGSRRQLPPHAAAPSSR